MLRNAMGKTTKTGGDAVREEQSAPGMPQYNQLQEDSSKRSSFSWKKRSEPIRVITAVPKAKEMETLALISALLLTVAGSGLFAGEGVEERYIFVNTTDYGVPYVPGFSIEPREWSIILYCVAIFCFLCSTMIASIIMIILLIEVPEETVKYALGSLFHAPKYYFVAGYIVLVAATTCFFLCLIPMLPTFGCLAFCSTLFILPTFMAISRGYRLLPA